MKNIKTFESFTTSTDEDIISDLLIDNRIIATNDKLHKDMPFRISSDTLEFTPKSFRIVGDALKIYVDMSEVEGSVSNLSKYSDEAVKCFIMSAWIYWEIISKNIDNHYDVMVYPLTKM